MNETEITVILPTSAAKELFFDGWLHGFEPSTWLKDRILKKLSNEPSTPRSARRAANRAAHAAGQAASSSAAAPTPEQAAEVARQLAEYGTPAPGEPATTLLHSDPLATRAPGYDPDFTPDPENFGTL